MKKTEVQILKSGYCTGNERHIFNGGSKRKCKFYAGFALIKHTELGFILFDTGYSNEFYKETKKFPYNLYAKITPVYFSEKDNELNVNKEDIKYVIISHFHADHICGLKKFPNAKFICSKKEYNSIKNKKGFSAVKQAFIPNLLPINFEDRAIFIEDFSKKINLEPFENCWDIFSDESIYAVELDGHTQGQIGIIVETDNKKFFLVSDACWTKKSYRENTPPPNYVLNFLGSREKYTRTLEKLHEYYKNNQNVEIIPSHCPEYWERNNV